ncbi:MAG: polysulfide reductase NrfD [Adlercreutzia sp.]|nr:polysulfide reductase NrfD [Adlercreutzia sp.]
MNSRNEGKALTGASRASWVVFSALSVVYAVALVVRLSGGPAVLEVSDMVPWSSLIAFFFLLAGAGAGLLTVAALAVFGLLPSLAGRERRLYIAAAACFIAAGLTVLVDLGRPERVLNMMLYMHMMSPFAWDFIFLALSVVLALAAAVLRPNRALAAVTAASGAAVALVEGVILAVCAGNEMWQSSLVPLLFLLEGLVAGFALVAVAAPDSSRRVAGVLAALLVALALFNAAEWIHAYGGATGGAEAMALLMGGPLAPLYWLQIIGGILVPVVLLVVRPSAAATRAAGVLALVGVVLGKYAILLAGQALDASGVFHAAWPSLLEVGLVAGAVGFAGLLFVAGVRWLPALAAEAKPAKTSRAVADELEAEAL